MTRILLILAVLAPAALSTSATIRVPTDYATIQGAVDAAQNDDVIIVNPGTYLLTDTLRLQKRVTLRSTFDESGWSAVSATVIKARDTIVLCSIAEDGVVLRGFTLTRDPINIPFNELVTAIGLVSSGSSATIENNIIENHVHVNGPPAQPGPSIGAAIAGVGGTIQKNIIRNNHADEGAAIHETLARVWNNVLYSNSSGLFECNGSILNNTFYNSGGISVGFGAAVVNDIFWTSTSDPIPYHASTPSYCFIKGYTGSGTTIVTADPQFVDPTNANFHLQSTSLAIDAGGAVTDGPGGDFEGIQRGVVGAPNRSRGDGSNIDIGAYEVNPSFSIWLPNGGPAAIHAGDTLDVAWQMDPVVAGTEINLFLYDDRSFVSGFGPYSSTTGAGRGQVHLPAGLRTEMTYTIKGVSSLDLRLANQTPPMTILGGALNAVPIPHWSGFR